MRRRVVIGTLLAATVLLGWRLHTNLARGRSIFLSRISGFSPLTPTLSPSDGEREKTKGGLLRLSPVLAEGHQNSGFTSSVPPSPPNLAPVSVPPSGRGGIGRRLSNTTNSLSKLTRNPSAILLQNALLDTSLPISLSIPDSLKAQSGSGSYIVQARGPPDAAFRALVTRAGGSIVSYIPNNAFLVRASENSALGLRSSALVQSVLPYEHKLSRPGCF